MSTEQGSGGRVRAWVREWGLALLFGVLWDVLSHALGLSAWASLVGAFLAGAAMGLALAVTRSRRRCDRR